MFPPHMQLVTDLCLVRDWRRRDKADLLRLANDRAIWRNLTHRFPHPYTEADADEWFAQLAGMREVTHWAIEAEGALAGGIGLEIGVGVYARTARLGYWVGRPFEGRGIATSAVRVVSARALSAFALSRVEAAVFAWNPASARVLEKAGFTREGVLRHSIFKDGKVIDSIMYALTE